MQAEIERVLAIVTGAPVRVFASGRTDSGVHASGQVVAFDVAEGTDVAKLLRSLNAMTERSIAFADLAPTNAALDPRRHALSRSYEYTILNQGPPSPFLLDRAWHVFAPLDVEALQRLASRVIGEHDFTAFRAADCASASTRRFVSESTWTRSGNIVTYRVSANAFLKQMVRTLVGSMVDVVQGRLEESTFVELLGGGLRTRAGKTAPAEGLSLVAVEYPEEFAVSSWESTNAQSASPAQDEDLES